MFYQNSCSFSPILNYFWSMHVLIYLWIFFISIARLFTVALTIFMSMLSRCIKATPDCRGRFSPTLYQHVHSTKFGINWPRCLGVHICWLSYRVITHYSKNAIFRNYETSIITCWICYMQYLVGTPILHLFVLAMTFPAGHDKVLLFVNYSLIVRTNGDCDALKMKLCVGHEIVPYFNYKKR